MNTYQVILHNGEKCHIAADKFNCKLIGQTEHFIGYEFKKDDVVIAFFSVTAVAGIFKDPQ